MHIHDLSRLGSTCPNIHEEFMSGNFVTSKAGRKFSLLPHYQIHEQLNAMVKGDGGATGLIENPTALRRWMVAGPEIASLVSEYNDKLLNKIPQENHHEQCAHIQTSFHKATLNFVHSFDQFRNPFKDKDKSLYSLAQRKLFLKTVYHP